ncbi:MAG: formate dehydrogenase accessory sulfurtransferase FdhD [Planctomycetota bacterium]
MSDAPNGPEPSADTTTPVRVVRVRDGERAEVGDRVVREESVVLYVGERRLLRLQCLPVGVEDLAVGLLATSGLLEPGAAAPEVTYDADAHRATVALDVPEERLAALEATMTLGSGCGAALSPTGEFDPFDCSRKIDTSFSVAAQTVSAAMTAFSQRSRLFRETGGVHSAAICRDDQILAFADDIGRHNAFDKVIGACRRRGIDLVDKTALVSGRLSRELVAKAVPVSLPVVVSRGAPTDAGIILAAAANLTLIGFARASRMNVYSADWRVA